MSQEYEQGMTNDQLSLHMQHGVCYSQKEGACHVNDSNQAEMRLTMQQVNIHLGQLCDAMKECLGEARHDQLAVQVKL